MPNHDYVCKKHGEFERTVPLGADVPPDASCPECGEKSPWKPPTVAVIWNCPK